MAASSYNIAPGTSAEDLALRRKLAYALLQQGASTAPVQHWTQGLARMLQAGLGGYELNKAEKSDNADKSAAREIYAKLLGANTAVPATNGMAASPAEPSTVPAALPAVAVPPKNTVGKIYSNNEPSPLDPPTPAERDLMIRTVYGEQGKQNPQEWSAIANVIRNRTVSGKYGGDTVPGVVLAKNQFEPWNRRDATARMLAMSATDPRYQAIGKAVDNAYSQIEPDPTAGATHFFGPKDQAALGRPVPSWAQGRPGQDIGESRFYNLQAANAPAPPAAAPTTAAPSAAPASAPVASPTAAPAAAVNASIPPVNRQALIGMLNNRYTAPMAQQILGSLIQQQFSQKQPIKIGEGDTLLDPRTYKPIATGPGKATFGVIGENQMGVKQYGIIRANKGEVTPYNSQGTSNNKTIDPNLTGDAFLKAIAADPSLGPGEANKVKSIAEGRTPYPTGFIMKTPYGRWLTSAVGQYEPGVDANLLGRRATFQKQLGSAAPSSVGGQKTLMGTSLGHLAELADAAVGLNNISAFGIAPLAHIANLARGTSTEQSAKINKLEETVDRFSGEVGKLYSGSAGGGVQERDQTRARFSSVKSPEELAGALEASRDLIRSKLAALENQQNEIFGPNNKMRIDFLGKSGREALAKIDAAIAKLRGKQLRNDQPVSTNGAVPPPPPGFVVQ